MSIEHIGKGYVKICVSEEELENSIAGLSQLKPILQTQVMKGNGRNTKQGLIDAAELGKHFDTAIDAMTMLLVLKCISCRAWTMRKSQRNWIQERTHRGAGLRAS